MKKVFILSILLFNIIFVVAQTNYYTTTKTFHEKGYTYQCDVSNYGKVKLYSSTNKWTYVDQMKKGTDTPFYIKAEDYDIDPFTVKDTHYVYNDSIYKVIVNDAFGSYKGKMKGFELFIILSISSETGKISELYFNFLESTPYVTVPVSVYREIETKLVGLKYTLTPLAKTLNYVYQWWAIEPK